MERIDELHFQNLQDGWSKLYYYMAQNLIDDLGVEGEKVMRQGIRDYGADRGAALRRKHQGLGLKPNLYNLFTYGDLPNDPRFRRNKIKLNSQERLSETLICPIALVWSEMGGKKLGRIYCEEIHHYFYGTYAPKAQINLSKTLTQDVDDFCRFSLYLRPANMDSEERKETFEEFDPGYKSTLKDYPYMSPRDSFETLAIKLYYNTTAAAISALGEKAKPTIVKAIEQFAVDLGDFMIFKASAFGKPLNNEFLDRSSIIELRQGTNYTSVWNCYENKEPQKIFEAAFFSTFQNVLGVK